MTPRKVLLVCGVPAAGKSTFAQHLVETHQFVHYDLERYPSGWPDASLKTAWDASRSEFVAAVARRHGHVVLDWGFPPHCLDWVQQLAAAGCAVCWFDGTRSHAEAAYVRRGTGTIENFVRQMNGIESADFPASLPAGSLIVQAFDKRGRHVKAHALCGRLQLAR